jgi:hypothetical protein
MPFFIWRITMATKTPRRTRPAAPATTNTAPRPAKVPPRVEVEYIDITDLAGYTLNPRDNSKAIASVANSIQTFGFLVPCVIDDNNILITGHTRVEAAKSLQMTEVPCIRASNLTPEQANAFRLVDNRVSEIAVWDFDLLAGEIGKLDGMGLDFTQFGWSQTELDCLQHLVNEDCLSTSNLIPSQDVESAQQPRRGPQSARVVIGELVFFTPIENYRSWVDGIRQLCDFNEESITAELKRRLGMS